MKGSSETTLSTLKGHRDVVNESLMWREGKRRTKIIVWSFYLIFIFTFSKKLSPFSLFVEKEKKGKETAFVSCGQDD